MNGYKIHKGSTIHYVCGTSVITIKRELKDEFGTATETFPINFHGDVKAAMLLINEIKKQLRE